MNVVTGAAASHTLPTNVISDPNAIKERFSVYLADESKLRADSVDSLAFPTSTAEVSGILARHFSERRPIRVSGGRTGITGASVAEPGDAIVSLEKMKHIGGVDVRGNRAFINVQAGVTLQELNEHLSSQSEWYFPVDPTETWAALGGMAATNASGARSYRYGAMRRWVSAASIVLVDGTQLRLTRGVERIENETLALSVGGAARTLKLQAIPKPPTKNTIGYHFADGDALDVFIGSEGTLGVFTELELELAPVPKLRLYLLQIFPSVDAALTFVEGLRSSTLDLLAIELFDRRALALAKGSPHVAQSGPAQLVGDGSAAAIYVEIVLRSEDDLEDAFETLSGLLEPLGASLDSSFAGTEDRELRELKAFRHAVPERINSLIASRKEQFPTLHKVATDMAVPDAALKAVYHLYESALKDAGLDYAVFGHAGNNHFHVNILPRDEAELKAGKALYARFAADVVRLGGAVAAEHGIGKLKREFLSVQYPQAVLDRMRAMKDFFDPNHLLNRKVLFE